MRWSLTAPVEQQTFPVVVSFAKATTQAIQVPDLAASITKANSTFRVALTSRTLPEISWPSLANLRSSSEVYEERNI